MKNSKNKKGFTMVEILVVVGLIAILGVVAVISFGNIQTGVRRATVSADARSLATVINTASALGDNLANSATVTAGAFPTTNDAIPTIDTTGTGANVGTTFRDIVIVNAQVALPPTTIIVSAGPRSRAVLNSVQIVGGIATVNQAFVDGLTDAMMVEADGTVTFRVGAITSSTAAAFPQP